MARWKYIRFPFSLFLCQVVLLDMWKILLHTVSDYAAPVPSSTSAVAIVAVFLFLVVLLKKRRTSIPPLPPGPKGLPLVGNLLSLDPELHTHFFKLSQSHGPIFTLKLGKKIAIVITSQTLAKEVLRNQDAIFANRDVPVAGNEASYGGANIVWTPYGPTWRKLRKVSVAKMLSGKHLDSVYGLRRREIRKMINDIYGRAGTPVDVGEQMFLTVLNVITGMMWGGTVKGEEGRRPGGEFKKVVGEMTELLGMPNVSDFYPQLERFDLQGIKRKMKRLIKELDRIFETIIEQRVRTNEGEGGEEESTDFLQVLLRMKDDEDDKTPFTMIHVKALLMDMVLGGTDTTSNTVEFALAEMINKPEVLRKVQQELDAVVGNDTVVEESHTNKLPYLYCIMKETLRLHPSLPLLVQHCPSTACSMVGYSIPKGARVFVNVWAIHRDASIWENPLEFYPERFEDSKWDYSGNDFNYFPFGSGRRICAGTPMAEKMFMHALASLVHAFEWSLPRGERLDLSEKFGIVMKKKTPLIAIPTPRLSNPSLYE